MTPSRKSLYLKRRAHGFESHVERASRTDEPWTDRNVRMWQGYMARDWRDRSAIIRAYLDQRKNRAAS